MTWMRDDEPSFFCQAGNKGHLSSIEKTRRVFSCWILGRYLLAAVPSIRNRRYTPVVFVPVGNLCTYLGKAPPNG